MMRFKYLISIGSCCWHLSPGETCTHLCAVGTDQEPEHKPISARKSLFKEDFKCCVRLSQSCPAQTFSDLTTSLIRDTLVAIVN